MVDMHSHVLPCMDDGAKSVDESIAMLKSAYGQGVRYVVATPHCRVHKTSDIYEFLEKREASYTALSKAIASENESLPKILLGAEVALFAELSSVAELKKLCIGDTNCILLEPMFENMCEAVGEWIYEVGLKGLKPVVAHIDRYSDEALLKMGIFQLDAVMQINADAFLSMAGRRCVKRYLTENKMFVAGSDMHNMKLRKCEIQKAFKWAKKMNHQIAEEMFCSNPIALLRL